MSNAFLDAKPRRLARLAVVSVAAAVAIAIVVLVLVVVRGTGHTTAASTPVQSVTSPVSTSNATSSGPRLGPIDLVQGSSLLNGVYVGYPHTIVGAVSAAVEYETQIASTLDPDRAAAVARVVADPSWTNVAAQAAQGAVNARKAINLPTDGAVPPNTSVELTVAQYQLRNVKANTITVLLLADYSQMLPSADSKVSLGVFPMRMHWADGDWKVMPSTGDTDYSSLAVQPGSVEAESAGWQNLLRS